MDNSASDELLAAAEDKVSDVYTTGEEMLLDLQQSQRQTFLATQRDDLIMSASVFVVIFLLRYALQTIVFKPLARRCIADPKKDDKVSETTYLKRLDKFNESCWKAFIYTVFTCIELYAAWGQSWIFDSRQLWAGCNQIPCNYTVPPKIYFLYVVQIGFYSYCIPALIWWETRRKDFLASMGHHVATLILLLYSYYLNFTVVGAMVLLLHDCCDVLIELAKVCVYVKAERLKEVLFVSFTLLWIATRVIYYPLHVIKSTLFDTLELAREHNVDPQPHHTIFNGFLIFLYVLHLYWTYLILVILKNAVTSNELKDDREDSDDD